jgi:hypothetical protein
MISRRIARCLGVAAFCLTINSLPAAAETRVALVVGNSAYQHTSPLRNPRHDAADVAAVLKGLGFRTVVGLDLDKAAMDRKVRDFAASADEGAARFPERRAAAAGALPRY